MRETDNATRRLYERIVTAPDNREFIDAVTQRAGRNVHADSRIVDTAAIVLVPGIFYRDYPHTGADGALLRRLAESLAIPFTTIPVDGTEGIDAAADLINASLRSMSEAKPIVLFSLSKGSAEVRHALTKPQAAQAFSNVIAWVSVSGLPFGTPSLELFISNPLRRAFLRALCWVKRWRLDRIRDVLRYRPSAAVNLPCNLRFVQVAGFPEHAHLCDRRSRRHHEQLAAIGPNDGFAILEELAALPGSFYPIWGADHYLHGVDDLPAKIAAIIDYLVDRYRATSSERRSDIA